MTPTRAEPPRRRPGAPTQATYTRRRLLVAAAAIGIPAITVHRIRSGQVSADTSTVAPTVALPVQAQPATAVTSGPALPAPTATVAPTNFRTVEPGMVGDEVALLQQRLITLRFDPGPVDGHFGPSTTRAVWAAKRMLLDGAGSTVDAVVTPDTADALHAAPPPPPRRRNSGTSTHTEIYLPEQVIAVFRDGEAILVSHMSSGELDDDGEPAEWCEIVSIDTDDRGNPLPERVDKDICGRSKTPGGVFDFYRRVDGFRHGALGSMWNPVYFNYGIAVHGATNVPNHPASHGCVRIPMHIADYFPTLVANGDAVLVWNGLTEPEAVTEDDRLPVFDYPNPNATTTTTTTTTTAPNTTTSTTPPTTTTSTAASTTTSTTGNPPTPGTTPEPAANAEG